MEAQKIFFSYSRFDSPFALKLAKDLRESGAEIWVDQLDIQAGSHWDAAVEKALDNAACVLVILSPTSIVSPNVMDEVSFALETGKRIIPVLFVDCLTPFRLRRLQRVDFTGEYTSGLNQLIQSLSLKPNLIPMKESTSAEVKVFSVGNGINVTDDRSEWEDSLWEEACTVNTIAAYKKYLSESVSGAYKSEARLLIKQQELEQKEDEVDALLWQKAKSNHSRNLYEHYLHEHPHGNYKTLALAALADLDKTERHEEKHRVAISVTQSQQTGAEMMSSSLSKKRLTIIVSGIVIVCIGLMGFLKMNSENGELAAWANALQKNDSLAYVTYMKHFPTGAYVTIAKEKLDSLNIAHQSNFDSLQVNLTASILTDTQVQIIATPVIPKVDTVVKSMITPVKPKSTVATPKSVSKLKPGQKYQGGIIVYLNAAGDHGLIAAVKEEGQHTWESAKKKCDNYKAEGFNDWRLPSKDELKKMYQGRKYLGTYVKGVYWSSNEENKTLAWTHNFISGNMANGNKQSSLNVRAVRSF